MKKNYCDTGSRIKQLREKKHYTRECLAELTDISAKFLYEIENGKKGFSADILRRLVEALETNADYILFGEYRGKLDSEDIRILNLFGSSQKDAVIELLKIIYGFSHGQ